MLFAPSYDDLALDPNGSRVVEAVFDVGSYQNRLHIAEELVPRYAEINATLHGMMCCRKIQVDLFQSRRDQWEEQQQKKQKAKKMMRNILGE
jgi:hypothetical protein